MRLKAFKYKPKPSELKNCHSERYEVQAVVLFFDYPEQGGSMPLLNPDTDITQTAGILIDYHRYSSFNIRQYEFCYYKQCHEVA
jgi:hypothetical protein